MKPSPALLSLLLALGACDPIVTIEIVKPNGSGTSTGDTGDGTDTVGSDPTDDPTDTTDTAEDTTETTETTDGTATAGTGLVERVDVYCDGQDRVHLEIDVAGPAVRGRIFMEETANVDPHWSENHTLALAGGDGTVNWLERELETGVNLPQQATNQSSVFWCDAFFDLGDQIMTYAFLAEDAAGTPTDCVLIGHDPVGMANRDWDRVNEPDFDLTQCRLGP